MKRMEMPSLVPQMAKVLCQIIQTIWLEIWSFDINHPYKQLGRKISLRYLVYARYRSAFIPLKKYIYNFKQNELIIIILILFLLLSYSIRLQILE
ncbi:unnamed protein product [Trichobilharzia regenti]|nr:unnamed protein product [Trichobilharzia regenti]